MRIALLHYHQRPSGVNQVISLQAKVLKALGHEVLIPDLPELDYSTTPLLSGAELLQRLKDLVPKIDLWIIHNPTLGKNATFPDFIRELAQKGVPIVLQCHDFAEDGRPTNYQGLSQTTHLYPLAPHIHYAVINSRDAGILEKGGIPTSQIHFLPNAVTRAALPPAPADSPFILYPVRGIRRKNLGELCLWAKHAPAGTRFAIASKPENPAWIACFEDWENFTQQENLPVEFDVVSDEQPFDFWLKKSTHLATTSIAEGFGLTFIEPHFLGRPLIGRDLPEITRDFSAEGLTSANLYPEIAVPLEALDLTKLKDDFCTQIEATFSTYGQSLDAASTWECFIENGTVDFGNLPEIHQQELIRNHHFPDLKAWLAQALSESTVPTQNTEAWSSHRYQERIIKILTEVCSASPATPDFLPKENILSQFLNPKRFHFLRT